jgi:hypothetical protein
MNHKIFFLTSVMYLSSLYNVSLNVIPAQAGIQVKKAGFRPTPIGSLA